MPAETGIVEHTIDFQKGSFHGPRPVAHLHFNDRPINLLHSLRDLRQAPSQARSIAETTTTSSTLSTTTTVSPRLGPITLAVPSPRGRAQRHHRLRRRRQGQGGRTSFQPWLSRRIVGRTRTYRVSFQLLARGKENIQRAGLAGRGFAAAAVTLGACRREDLEGQARPPLPFDVSVQVSEQGVILSPTRGSSAGIATFTIADARRPARPSSPSTARPSTRATRIFTGAHQRPQGPRSSQQTTGPR